MDYEMEYKELVAKLKEAYNDENVRDERFCCVINSIMPELAESDDEKIRRWLYEMLKAGIEQDPHPFSEDANMAKKGLAWLEKQGEQKPVEWSKEDEEMKESIIATLKANKAFLYQHEKLGQIDHDRKINWLKSIRPQKQWKPSEELMYALRSVVSELKHTDNKYQEYIEVLYEQLKDL